MHDVVIAGGGPTGLMLAAELALAGVDVVILERRATPELVGSRAGGLHARALELLDQRGVADRFLEAGKPVQVHQFGGTTVDLSDFPTRFPHSLGLWQNHIERLLRDWVGELGVPTRWGVEVSGFAQDETGVDIHCGQHVPVRARYLVGADGGRSLIRSAAGIEFAGWDATRTSLIAEVEMRDETPAGVRIDDVGVHGMHVMEDGHTVRVIVTEHERRSGETGLAELIVALRDVYGTDFGAHDPRWISRFSDATRQAVEYRVGRVLIAGDAAHVHSPAGGQGISLGLADAVNLGWKLAQVIRGSDASLLDTYRAERHPATARSLRFTMAQTLFQRADARIDALRELVSDLADFDGPRMVVAGLASGLDVQYDLGAGHPLLGRRVPDLTLNAGGVSRLYELLHDARPLVLTVDEAHREQACGAVTALGWATQVRVVSTEYTGPWELPVLGAVRAPTGILIRPDGHVAWVADGNCDGLAEALTTWFGPARA